MVFFLICPEKVYFNRFNWLNSMRISKKRVNGQRKKEIFDLLLQTIADIKSKEEAKIILENLLSKTELSAVSKRLGVVYCLDKGLSYQKIKKELKVSSATISSLAENLENKNGFQLALKKIKADEWANRWANRINAVLRLNRN